MGDKSPERRSGCGFISAVFGRRSFCPPRRPTESSSHNPAGAAEFSKPPAAQDNSKRRRAGPPPQPQRQPQRLVVPAGEAKPCSYQVYVNQGRRVPKEAVGISGELESMIIDHQKAKGAGNLVRASSSNVMLHGNLGNLRQPNGAAAVPAESPVPVGRYGTKPVGERGVKGSVGSLCRALSTRMDPETLKMMGNEDYKNGRFAEALALYEAAIAIDGNKASYRSNKSAALTALGRLLEAVLECREAIRIDPHYHRAHHRLASLYLRLGEADKATYHYKHAGQEADRDDLAKVKSIQSHLIKCTEARRMRDWNTLVKETHFAISAGADSAPQIYALQAEALLKLHRHEEADKVLSRGPKFDVDDCTKFLGPIGNATLLVTRAQVDMAIGRFDDALEAAQRATRLDSNNREANVMARKARAVGAARAKGNELFKAARFSEACVAYGEGLEHDPYNSMLLCNRAACRTKLGHFEKAVEDCTVALNVRPSYTKARLRRADCFAKLGRWESSIQDYEVLMKDTPEDEYVRNALSEARAHLVKRHGGTETANGGVIAIGSS